MQGSCHYKTLRYSVDACIVSNPGALQDVYVQNSISGQTAGAEIGRIGVGARIISKSNRVISDLLTSRCRRRERESSPTVQFLPASDLER